MAKQQPQSFGVVSESLPKMLNAVDATVPVSERLASPDYNPSNILSETGIEVSINRPDLRADRRDLRQDEKQLDEDKAKLYLDRLEHKSKSVIDKEKEKIKAVEKGF